MPRRLKHKNQNKAIIVDCKSAEQKESTTAESKTETY